MREEVKSLLLGNIESSGSDGQTDVNHESSVSCGYGE